MSLMFGLGLPGNGKTLYGLWLLAQYTRVGRPCASNISLTERCPFAHRVAKLDDGCGEWPVFREADPANHKEYRAFWHYLAEGFFIEIDEIDNYFDSMDFARLAKVAHDCKLMHKQHRKLGYDLFYTAQCIDNVYNRITRMASKFIVCEWNYRRNPLFKHLPVSWSSFIRAEYSHPSLTDRFLMGTGYFSYAEASAMFPWYSTEELIGDTSFYRWREKEKNRANGNPGCVDVGSGGGFEVGRGAFTDGAETSAVDQICPGSGVVLRGAGVDHESACGESVATSGGSACEPGLSDRGRRRRRRSALSYLVGLFTGIKGTSPT